MRKIDRIIEIVYLTDESVLVKRINSLGVSESQTQMTGPSF
jgi:hypothetical protein